MLQNFRFLITILILAYSPLINASDEAIFKVPSKPIGRKLPGNSVPQPEEYKLLISSNSMVKEPKFDIRFTPQKDQVGNFNDWDFTKKEIENSFTLCAQEIDFIEISLKNCKLHTLPRALLRLTSLRILDLSQNDFSTGLREAIEGKNPLQKLSLLTQLKELYLNNCRINVLPDSLRELKELSRVELMYNQLEMPKQCILAYFQPNAIVIVGEQGRHLKNEFKNI